MSSPLVTAELAHGPGRALEAFRARSGGMPAALNLCQSYIGRGSDGVVLDAALMNRAIDVLLDKNNGPLPVG